MLYSNLRIIFLLPPNDVLKEWILLTDAQRMPCKAFNHEVAEMAPGSNESFPAPFLEDLKLLAASQYWLS